MPDMGAATQALLEGSVDAIVHLRGDFAARERSPGGAAVQVIVNGVDANNSRLVEGYLDGALSTWLAAARGRRRGSTRPSRCASSTASGTTPTCAAATSWCPGWWW